MTDLPSLRPDQLKDARVALAYERWLTANELSDSDLTAWRFIAESGLGSAPTTGATADRTPTATTGRWWIPLTILGTAIALVLFVMFGFMSARHWTKVDAEETGHSVQVPTGRWIVSMVDKDACYVGQDYWDCIDAYTSEWNFACAERAITESSRPICDQYDELIQEMKTDQAGNQWSTVSGLVHSGRLSISEETKKKWVVDDPEQSHEAICYLGILGECE